MIRETSIEAYHKIKDDGLLSERRWQVYSVLYKIGPATGGEVFKEFKRQYGITTPTNSNVTTRLGELREMEVAKELGTRVCSVSGQNVILWDVTKSLPVKLEKAARIKCPHCKGTGHLNLAHQMKLF